MCIKDYIIVCSFSHDTAETIVDSPLNPQGSDGIIALDSNKRKRDESPNKFGSNPIPVAEAKRQINAQATQVDIRYIDKIGSVTERLLDVL